MPDTVIVVESQPSSSSLAPPPSNAPPPRISSQAAAAAAAGAGTGGSGASAVPPRRITVNARGGGGGVAVPVRIKASNDSNEASGAGGAPPTLNATTSSTVIPANLSTSATSAPVAARDAPQNAKGGVHATVISPMKKGQLHAVNNNSNNTNNIHHHSVQQPRSVRKAVPGVGMGAPLTPGTGRTRTSATATSTAVSTARRPMSARVGSGNVVVVTNGKSTSKQTTTTTTSSSVGARKMSTTSALATAPPAGTGATVQRGQSSKPTRIGGVSSTSRRQSADVSHNFQQPTLRSLHPSAKAAPSTTPGAASSTSQRARSATGVHRSRSKNSNPLMQTAPLGGGDAGRFTRIRSGSQGSKAGIRNAALLSELDMLLDENYCPADAVPSSQHRNRRNEQQYTATFMATSDLPLYRGDALDGVSRSHVLNGSNADYPIFSGGHSGAAAMGDDDCVNVRESLNGSGNITAAAEAAGKMYFSPSTRTGVTAMPMNMRESRVFRSGFGSGSPVRTRNNNNNNNNEKTYAAGEFQYRTDLDKPALHAAFARFPRCSELKPIPVSSISNGVNGAGGAVASPTQAQPSLSAAAASAAAAANTNNNNGRSDKDEAFLIGLATDWSVYWMSVQHIRLLFKTPGLRLSETQIINHFPDHQQLTRKDLMYKNIKKYIRERGTTIHSSTIYWNAGAGTSNAAYATSPLTYGMDVLAGAPLSVYDISKGEDSRSGGGAARFNGGGRSAYLLNTGGHANYTLAGPLSHMRAPQPPPLSSQEQKQQQGAGGGGASNNASPNRRRGSTMSILDGPPTAQSLSFANPKFGSDRGHYLGIKELRLTACVPVTFYLPNDRHMFAEELKRNPGSTWIVKPTNRSQGHGIFLINTYGQLARWLREKSAGNNSNNNSGDNAEGNQGISPGSPSGAGGAAAFSSPTAATGGNNQSTGPSDDVSSFIVSRYVDNPLLIGGKKFDLRLYVLVTSFKPLVAYIHKRGFARFCATKYNNDVFLSGGAGVGGPSSSSSAGQNVGGSSGNNAGSGAGIGASTATGDRDALGSHLTNVALQKGEEEYNTVHGGKWSFENLWLYIQGRYGSYAADAMIADIEFVIFHSLRAMEGEILSNRNAFELYGFDILVDDHLRPHLIEVNASPSLTASTESDRLWKEEVLHDTLRTVLPPGYPYRCELPYWEYRLRTDLTTRLNTGFKLLNGIPLKQ